MKTILEFNKMDESQKDEYFMHKAYQEALKALNENEIPVGAIVVCEDKIITRAHNQTELLNDVTAHAEMLAITSTSATLGGKYLQQCCLYVTLEPCVMCAGALAWSQIGRIVYGAQDKKRGYSRVKPEILHPRTIVKYGVLECDCSSLMIAFFKNKR
ncbi:MAG: nucleoside deaminase [Bacilli bacterium]